MPKQELLLKYIKNEVVLVTGAGGSIGSELCRQILRGKPKALILCELNEFYLYKI
jgi:FlaA1/EpsC-like NDP-sugar epimerase